MKRKHFLGFTIFTLCAFTLLPINSQTHSQAETPYTVDNEDNDSQSLTPIHIPAEGTNNIQKDSEDDFLPFIDIADLFSIPKFNGDIDKYIEKNLRYPKEAKRNGIQGRVICQFVVNEDGSISDIWVVRGADPNLDKEALRLIKSMPKWIPGYNTSGEPGRIRHTIPINFKL